MTTGKDLKDDRFRKQTLFGGLGAGGQDRLEKSRVLVAGAGALGGTEAALLVRAGVGLVRVVDFDFPDLSNLHRQMLYTEADLETGLTKAELAGQKLKAMNSRVKVEAVTARIDRENVLDLMADVDLIIDGLDNQATRYLINDAAVKLGLPWIWAGVVGASGNLAVIIPDRTPCLRCIQPDPLPEGTYPTVNSAGVINTNPNLVASLAVTEAFKLLTGAEDRLLPGLLSLDLWNNRFQTIPLDRAIDPSCPCCQKGRFEYLGADEG